MQRVFNNPQTYAQRSSTAAGAGTVSGTNTGDQTTITGNAGTATTLQTARLINGVSFNGSADITINAVDATDRLALTGGTLTGPLNLSGAAVYQVAGLQVVGSRKVGWAAATGTATRTTFDTATVTLPLLAERVKALIDDLHAAAGHGLIGA